MADSLGHSTATAAGKKKMNLMQLTFIVAVNMMGSGIIMLPANMAQVGAISLLSWLVTAVGSMAIAYGFAQCGLFNQRAGGLYQQPLPWELQLDAYVQGGVVGISRRDLFVDGGFTATRPLFRNYSIGAGVWGGAQPGLYRVDAGPRLSMKVRNNVRVHLDWRQRLVGKADPGSGPALTLAADF